MVSAKTKTGTATKLLRLVETKKHTENESSLSAETEPKTKTVILIFIDANIVSNNMKQRKLTNTFSDAIILIFVLSNLTPRMLNCLPMHNVSHWN